MGMCFSRHQDSVSRDVCWRLVYLYRWYVEDIDYNGKVTVVQRGRIWTRDIYIARGEGLWWIKVSSPTEGELLQKRVRIETREILYPFSE